MTTQLPSCRKRSDLRPYQSFLADKIVTQEAAGLWVDMSLGKTITTLTAIADLMRDFEITWVLVVCPLRVAENTWPDEVAGWDHTRGLSYSVLTGAPDERERARRKFVDIHIVNQENFAWLIDAWGDDWPYDMIVFDDVTGIKEGKRRNKPGKKKIEAAAKEGVKAKGTPTRFARIVSIRKKVKKIVTLTGTPTPNGLTDLWGHTYVLDLGQRLGGSRNFFLQRWFSADYLGYNWTPREGAFEEVMAKVSDLFYGLRAEDHVALPSVIVSDMFVDLPPKLMAEYRVFERERVSEVYDVEAVSQGVLTNKLLQFCNGFLYRTFEDGRPRETVKIHSLKLDVLEQIVHENAGKPILVAYSFEEDRDAIRKRFPKVVLFDEEPNAVRLWNQGKIQMLLAHPASIGHGLNLQFGGHIAVWYGMTWNLEQYLQFNKRLPRPGQPNEHVFIYRILARGTMDETAAEALGAKNATQDSVTKAVVVRLKGLD